MTTLTVCGAKGWRVILLGLAMGGCVSTGAARTPARDIRGDASVAGHEVRPLVAGPIRLLHANFDARAHLQFSRVWRRDASADCHSGTPLDWDGESAVVVGKDELICVAAARPTKVWWHGRSLAAPSPLAHQQASLP